MVTAPVRAGDSNLAVCGCGEGRALLVAVRAEIAHTAIIGRIRGDELDRGNGL